MAARGGGRGRGVKNYNKNALLDAVASILPTSAVGWGQVAVLYQSSSGEVTPRDPMDVKRYFMEKCCNKMRAPTGSAGGKEDEIYRAQSLYLRMEAKENATSFGGDHSGAQAADLVGDLEGEELMDDHDDGSSYAGTTEDLSPSGLHVDEALHLRDTTTTSSAISSAAALPIDSSAVALLASSANTATASASMDGATSTLRPPSSSISSLKRRRLSSGDSSLTTGSNNDESNKSKNSRPSSTNPRGQMQGALINLCSSVAEMKEQEARKDENNSFMMIMQMMMQQSENDRAREREQSQQQQNFFMAMMQQQQQQMMNMMMMMNNNNNHYYVRHRSPPQQPSSDSVTSPPPPSIMMMAPPPPPSSSDPTPLSPPYDDPDAWRDREYN